MLLASVLLSADEGTDDETEKPPAAKPPSVRRTPTAGTVQQQQKHAVQLLRRQAALEVRDRKLTLAQRPRRNTCAPPKFLATNTRGFDLCAQWV